MREGREEGAVLYKGPPASVSTKQLGGGGVGGVHPRNAALPEAPGRPGEVAPPSRMVMFCRMVALGEAMKEDPPPPPPARGLSRL